MKAVYISETIAACDMKAIRCRERVDLMKRCDYSRSRSFLDIGPSSFTYEN